MYGKTHVNFVCFDEVDERPALDLDRLSLFVVQRQHEVEEVRLAQVRRGLLLQMRPTQTAAERCEQISSKEPAQTSKSRSTIFAFAKNCLTKSEQLFNPASPPPDTIVRLSGKQNYRRVIHVLSRLSDRWELSDIFQPFSSINDFPKLGSTFAKCSSESSKCLSPHQALSDTLINSILVPAFSRKYLRLGCSAEIFEISKILSKYYSRERSERKIFRLFLLECL